MTPRILFVTPTPPSDTSFGSAQRTSLLHRALSEVGRVDTLVVSEGSEAPQRDLGSDIVAALSVPARSWHRRYSVSPPVREWWLRNRETRGYKAVVGRYLSQLSMLGGLDGVPSVVDADDAYYCYAQGSSLRENVASTIKGAARTLVTGRALRNYGHVWFCSPRDQAFFNVGRSSVLPNISCSVPAEIDPPGDHTCTILMVGSLWYSPNRDGVDWFLRQCWQTILASFPAARLRVIGACSLEQRNQWMKTPHVECPGFVDDIAQEYSNARFTITPIRYGGGTQIKAIESYAFGRPTVVSGFVHEGMSAWFKEGESVLVARSADQMAAHCIALLRDASTAARLAAKGRQIIERDLSWPAFRSRVAETLQQVMEGSPDEQPV